MNIFKIFSWPAGSSTNGNAQTQSDFTWDDLPEVAQIHVIEFLDRTSLNNMRQISTSARFLSENYSGIHVIIPARNWTIPKYNFLGLPFASVGPVPITYPKRSITDSIICHIVRQMAGKRIKTLEMSEMPPSFTPFPFEKLIQYPAWLHHVKMKYLDVEFINDILTKCRNLRSLQYTTSLWRILPSGIFAMLTVHTSFQAVPVPANNDKLLQKINNFPNNVPIRLEHLRELTLSIGRMASTFSSDWGNVTYILLVLPVLPSLKKFNFDFRPGIMRLYWKIHLLILSCVAEFLGKTPNLQEFQYQSTFETLPDGLQVRTIEWVNFLTRLINKFGSDELIEIGEAAEGQAPIITFRVLVQQFMRAASESLTNLNVLDLRLGDTNEHAIFSGFAASIRSRLTSCKITDLTRQGLELDDDRRNVHHVFTLPDRQNGRLKVYQSITRLKISCVFTHFHPEASLTRILESLPELKELEITLCTRDDIPMMIPIPVPIPARGADISIIQGNTTYPVTFSGLEKLCFQNVNVRSVPDLPVPVFSHFKNIRELKIVNDTFARNFSLRDLAIVLASLPKLNIMHAKPVFKVVNVPPQELFNLNYVRDLIKEDESIIALGDTGTLKHESTTMFSSSAQGILNLCSYYEFFFGGANDEN